VGLFSKLFGRRAKPETETEIETETETETETEAPDAVVVLRKGMNLPDAAYIDAVVARVFAGGLPESVRRVGLSQPSWFKTEEVADNIAQSVVEAFARKLELGDVTSRRHAVDGPDGCACMLVELRRHGD
jgi:hypothetical protein